MGRYSISAKLDCGYEEALDRARSALEKEGFGILSEVNVSESIKKSINRNLRKYHIFGALDHALFFQALTIEPEAGLFFPGRVVIYENDEGGCTVSGADPVIAASMTDNPALALVAKEVREKMERLIKSLC